MKPQLVADTNGNPYSAYVVELPDGTVLQVDEEIVNLQPEGPTDFMLREVINHYELKLRSQ